MSFLKVTHHPDLTDQQLVLLYQQEGDLSILAELYQRYMEMLLAVCMKYLPDAESAKDAVMAVFEELISKLKNHNVQQFKGWVYMVTKNHCLMELRRRKKMPVADLIMQLPDSVHLNDAFEKEANLTALSDCIEKLSSDQKRVVRLFYLEEKSYREISDQNNIEWNQVRSMIQNARRNLKNCLEQHKKAND